MEAGAQTVARRFVDQNKGDASKSYFLYQSTLRSFSDKNSDAFNKLIADVDRIAIHFVGQKVESAALEKLKKDLELDGFELMKDFEQKGAFVYRKKDDNKEYVMLAVQQDAVVVVELFGTLNLKYLPALKELNADKVAAFFGVNPNAKAND